jgi:predicted nucleic acid-binding Zn ribbon protein
MEQIPTTIQQGDANLQESNISSLWLKNLFDSFARLQNYERNCRDGCTEIIEYIEQNPQRLSEIQFMYLRMAITELGIILGNTKPKLDKKFFLHARVHLKQMKNAVDTTPEKVFVPVFNQLNNTTNYFLSNEYWNMLDEISRIREKVIMELSDMLYGKGETKIESMDKSQSLSGILIK